MSKYKFSDIERFAVWKTHGSKCFWCGDPLRLFDTTVDHLFPESLLDKEEELIRVKKHYGLSSEFQINGFENWVPAHGTCNSKKSKTLYTNAPVMLAIIDRVVKESSYAKKTAEKLKLEREKDNVIGKILADLDTGNINKSDLYEILQYTKRENEIIVEKSQEKEQEKLAHLPAGWRIVSIDSNGLATVTNGNLAGITPTGANASIHWQCPNCGQYGPWNGVMCMSCGMKSDPFD